LIRILLIVVTATTVVILYRASEPADEVNLPAAALSPPAERPRPPSPPTPPLRDGVVGFYNYGRPEDRPGIGRFSYEQSAAHFAKEGPLVTPDMVRWTQPGGWIKSPSAVRFEGKIYVYFAGYRPPRWRGVGLVVLDERGRYARFPVPEGPVLPRQPGMGEYGGEFPRVLLDPEDPDPDRRWKMWMVFDPGFGYATSPDGVRWTFRGEVTAPRPPDVMYQWAGAVVKANDSYMIFSIEHRASRWSGGVLQSRRPEGPYTQGDGSFPSISPRRVDVGIRRLELGDTEGELDVDVKLLPGEPVYLFGPHMSFDDHVGPQLNQVLRVDGRRVTLAKPASVSFSGGTLRSWARDVYFTDVWRDADGLWKGLATAFHANANKENTALVIPVDQADLDGTWRFVTDQHATDGMPLWPAGWDGDANAADSTNVENAVLAD
jgi:hypothetical protein